MTMRAGAVPWPADLAEQYVQAGYWRQQPLGSLLWEWAGRFGPRTAVVDAGVRITYAELAAAADALAGQLAQRGVRRGDNVVVQLPNTWEFLVVLFACLRLGAAPLLALMPFGAHELTQLARLARVRAIIGPARWQDKSRLGLLAAVARACDPEPRVLLAGGGPGLAPELVLDLPALLRAAARLAAGQPAAGGQAAGELSTGEPVAGRQAWLDEAAPDPGDVALFLLSGGTTGTPKIISRTHNDYEYNARCSAAVCGFGPDTAYLAMLPLAHNFPLGSPGMLGTLMAGGKVVISPSPAPGRAWPLIAQEQVTVTSAVPAIARRWIQEAAPGDPRLASLSVLQVGGSVLPPDLAAAVTPALGCVLQQVFGMAEGLLNYTRLDDPEHVIRATQGRPASPGDEIMIVAADGRPVPPGAAGELLTRGPYTPRGYFAAPEHNRRAFTGGWYRTGDIVRQDPAGNLVVEGRSKDLINSGGEKVSAEEIEDLMRRLPQVADAAAIPLPDPGLGERVGVCAVLRAGATLTLTDIRGAFARHGVAAYKTPRHLQIMAELPLTPVGKVDKAALRRHAEASLQEGSRMNLSLSGIHHIAHVTEKPEETISFYRDVLGLPLVHTVSATGWISDGFPDFIHFFFALGNGTHLAFFYFFGTERPPAADDLERRARHLAFDVATQEEMEQWRERLRSAGIRVTRPLAHELVESIYFDDPNGIQLEICRPLRPFGPVDASDAELTLEALLKVVRSEDPSLQAVWRTKGDLIQGTLPGKAS